jgi:uncharacterized protein (UPF0276 family)
MIQTTDSVLPRLDGCAPVQATDLTGVAGTSFKPEHFEDILAECPHPHWFEVHAENYMMAGGPRHRILERIRREFPVSLHGVGMSIGGPQALDPAHVQRFAALVTRYEPAFVSEHLAWSTHGAVYYNDLLPLPYNETSLDYVCTHISQLQEALRRRILLENPSTYVAFATSTLSETQFLRTIVKRTGCGLLLDINNVLVSATNCGFSAAEYLNDFPIESVGEVHLAGHSEQTDDEGSPLLIDSHDREVGDAVWQLYKGVIGKHGPLPTLIEWDSQLPRWSALRRESLKAQTILDGRKLTGASADAA